MQLELNVALVPLARIHFDMELAKKCTEEFRRQLIYAGLRVSGNTVPATDLDKLSEKLREIDISTCDLIIVFQATFADSTMIVQLAEKLDTPILIWGVPEELTGDRLRLNSLCGINLAAHALKRKGKNFDYIFAPVNDKEGLNKVKAMTTASAACRQLRKYRLGVVGERPAGMDTCDFDPETMKQQVGVQAVQLDLQEIFERIRTVPDEKTDELRMQLDYKLPNLAELDQEPLKGTLNTFLVLNEIARAEKLDGLAVRCWPEFFTDLHCSACGALSLLIDSGIPTSCEVDVYGTVSQMILQLISGGLSYGTDMVAVDQERNAMVVWHCGHAPLSWCDPVFQPRGTVHSNRKLPLLMEFPLMPGKLTICRLNQNDQQLKLVVGRGEMISAPPSFSGTSGVLRFERPVHEVLDTVMKNGLEHHISITYGDHFDALLGIGNILGLPIIRL